MITSPLSSIWFNVESKTFYQIPTDFNLLEGNYRLERFDGVKKLVDEESLKEMRIDEAQVDGQITEFYEASKELFGKAMTAKTQFNLLSKGSGFEEMEELFNKLKADATYSNEGDWFSELKDLTEAQSMASDKDKKAFGDSLTELKDVLSLFDGKSMKKASENPEAWAAEMEGKFGVLEDLDKKKAKKKKKKKKAKKKEKMKKMIQQKIDEALTKEE